MQKIEGLDSNRKNPGLERIAEHIQNLQSAQIHAETFSVPEIPECGDQSSVAPFKSVQNDSLIELPFQDRARPLEQARHGVENDRALVRDRIEKRRTGELRNKHVPEYLPGGNKRRLSHALPEVDQKTPCAMVRLLLHLQLAALHIIKVIKLRIPKRNVRNRTNLFPEGFNRQIRRKRRSEFTT